MIYKIYCNPKDGLVTIVDADSESYKKLNHNWLLPNVRFRDYESALLYINDTFKREYIKKELRRSPNIFHPDMFKVPAINLQTIENEKEGEAL